MSEGHPYRATWAQAAGVMRPGAHRSSEDLRRELVALRERVDARQIDRRLTVDDIAATIRDLTTARDQLRLVARPARGALVYVVGLFGSSGAVLALIRLPSLAWLAISLAAVTAVVAAAASEWVQRWLDAVAEYDGLIADLRKYAAEVARDPVAPRLAGVFPCRVSDMDALGAEAAEFAKSLLKSGGDVRVTRVGDEFAVVREKNGQRDEFRFYAFAPPGTGVRVAIDAAQDDTEAAPAHEDVAKKREQR